MNINKLLQTIGLLALMMGVAFFTQSLTINNMQENKSNVISMEPFVGEVAMFSGNFAPRGWALCDGQLLSINEHTALFSILGTTYGGDGRTTFALPDLRGRTPIHAGRGPGLRDYRLGEKGGKEGVMLSSIHLPSHPINVSGDISIKIPRNNGADKDQPENPSATSSTTPKTSSRLPGKLRKQVNVGGTKKDAQLGTSDDTEKTVKASLENLRASYNNNNQQELPINNAYGTVNYIIALQGVYPSRN